MAGGEVGAAARPYAVRAARRFSRVALVTMLLLMGSGVAGAVAHVASLAGLVGTAHGRLLLAKLAALVPILIVAAVNRTHMLPALSESSDPVRDPVMRRLAAFVGLEASLALVLVALAAAMTVTTPARHADPIWPLPFRLALDAWPDIPAARGRAVLGSQLALAGLGVLVASLFVRRRRAPVLVGALALVASGAGVGLPPFVVDAYPTSYRRPLITYHAGSIAGGMTTTGRTARPATAPRASATERRTGDPRIFARLPLRFGARGSCSGWSRMAGRRAACRRSRAASEKPSAGT